MIPGPLIYLFFPPVHHEVKNLASKHDTLPKAHRPTSHKLDFLKLIIMNPSCYNVCLPGILLEH